MLFLVEELNGAADPRAASDSSSEVQSSWASFTLSAGAAFPMGALWPVVVGKPGLPWLGKFCSWVRGACWLERSGVGCCAVVYTHMAGFETNVVSLQ